MKKYINIKKESDNKFLNLFHMKALTDAGRPFDYYFVSRRKEDRLKLYTKDIQAEGVVIYPICKEEPEKIVMIRQYRYPLDDYLYELPAGLIDAGETPEQSAIREMKEETGLDFTPVEHEDCYSEPFFTTVGMTDESCRTVYGEAYGKPSNAFLEASEDIEVVLADRSMAKEILKTEKASVMAGYLLMNFIHSEDPFWFLK